VAKAFWARATMVTESNPVRVRIYSIYSLLPTENTLQIITAGLEKLCYICRT